MVKRQPRPAAVLYYHDHCQTYQVSYAGDLTTVDALTFTASDQTVFNRRVFYMDNVYDRTIAYYIVRVC